MEYEYLIFPDSAFTFAYRVTEEEAEEMFFQSIKDHPDLINKYMMSVRGIEKGIKEGGRESGRGGHTPLLYAMYRFSDGLRSFKITPRFKGMKIQDTLIYEIAHYLLDHGADVNIIDYRGQTTLHYLALSNSLFDYDLAKRILDLGGDLNIQDHALKCTPMHYASINNNASGYAALKLYLQYPYDINIKNHGGWTCYDLAVATGSNIYYPEEVQKEMDAKRIAEGKVEK